MSERVGNALRDLIKKTSPMQVVAAKVKSVDETDYTCEADPVDGAATIGRIRLKPVIDDSDTGMIVIPVVGSYILVGLLMNKDTQPFMVQWSKAKKVLIKTNYGATLEMDNQGVINMNGDSLGGMVKVQQLVQRLNNIESKLNAHLLLYNAHTHPVSGAVTLIPTPVDIQNMIQPITTQQDLENLKVKHGS